MASPDDRFPRLNGAVDPSTIVAPSITAPASQMYIDASQPGLARFRAPPQVSPPPAGTSAFPGISMANLPDAVPGLNAVMPVGRGGASGDWASPAAPTAAVQALPASPSIPAAVSAPAIHAARAPTAVSQPSLAGNGYNAQPVDAIRGMTLTQEYPMYDEAGRSRTGAAPSRGSSPIDAAFDRQLQMNQSMLDRALDYVNGGSDIFERATRGRLMAPMIGAIINGNDLGRSVAGNVNTQVSSAANVAGAGIGAAASRYSADQRLTGEQSALAEQHFRTATDSVPTGTTLQQDPTTGLSMPVTTYGQRPSEPGAMPLSYGSKATQPAEGTTGTSNGKPVVYVKGQWVPR